MNALRSETVPGAKLTQTDTSIRPANDDAYPPGLTLLLALLVGFVVIVAFVVYLAGQIPV